VGALPPVFIEFLGSATGFHSTAKGVKAELKNIERQGSSSFQQLATISKYAFLGVAAGAVIAGAHMVHMAADFDTAMTRVRTGAGESAANMKMVGDGVLRMAGEVGQSTEHLTTGLYTVESAGYHGADALNLLKVSAMGAKVGAAELGSVTDAVTTAMNAYGLKTNDVIKTQQNATDVMNALIGTEAEGKTNMEALAGSMASILPVSSSAKVGLNEVLGAMATMTAQGTSADVAATYLRQTIGQLSNATPKAAAEMKSLGLSSVEVSKNLGTNGLASTLNMLTDAIKAKMGPAGTVLIEHLQKASANATEFQKVLANIPPAQQTYIGALATMVGGTKSMMGALQLTGDHMKTFQENVKGISEHVKAGGRDIEGWKDVQATFNQKLAEAKGHFEALEITIGQKLMPVAMKIFDLFNEGTTWLAHHRVVVEALGGAIGGILAVGLVAASIAAWNFAAAMWATGIPELVILIAVLGAALVLLVMHWREVWTWIKQITKDVVDWLVGAWHWLANETASAWHTYIVAPIVAAWHSVAAFFSSAWHAVADPIVSAWHWISNVTAAVWHGISSFFAKWWPLLLLIFAAPIAILIGIWNRTHTAIAHTASSIWGGIADFFGGIWDWICGVALSTWTLVYQHVVLPTKQIGAFLMSLWDTLAGWLGAAWDWVAGKALSVWNLVYHYAVFPMKLLWADIKSIFGSIGSWIAEKWDEMLSFLSGAVHKFSAVGEGIVTGIINGLTGAWHWLTDKISNLAHDALNAAKSVLDINSPSKVFANVVGRAIPEGIALGVDQHADKATGAVRKLANAAIGAGSIGGLEPAFAGGSASLPSAGPVQHHTHVHVTVQGSVTADRDLADTIKRVMLQDAARNTGSYVPFRR
jgi:TP901 family phage tail tape measure protein